jgi:hypothetical protein
VPKDYGGQTKNTHSIGQQFIQKLRLWIITQGNPQGITDGIGTIEA